MSFKFHVDPGHGWLEVPQNMLNTLGMCASNFSKYSYRDRDRVFLEEDCDAAKFIAEWKLVMNREPEFKTVHSNSPSFIRRLPSIRS